MKRILAILLTMAVLAFFAYGQVSATPSVSYLQAIIQQGSALLGLNVPTWVDTRVLAANTEETHTIPSGAKYVLFSATTTFYAAYGATAAVPAADITNGSGSERNPVLRNITGFSTIHLISPTACVITLSFYK
jgi:hypothetical protein